MRVVSYARVSTERDQSPDAQVAVLKEFCAARKWEMVDVVIDHGFSGGTVQRPGLQRLLKLVRTRKVDCVVVMKLDRIARSLKHLVGLLDELTELGVMFVSVQDQLDMTTAAGRLMFHVVGAFAEFERALVRERTLIGLAHAVANGKRLGRPLTRNDREILALRGHGLSYRAIAKELGISRGAVCRALQGVSKRGKVVSQKRQGNHGAL